MAAIWSMVNARLSATLADMTDLVQRERPALAGFQILVEYLVAANVELPDGFGHRFEVLRLVDVDRVLIRRVADTFNLMVAASVVIRQTTAQNAFKQMRFDQRPTKTREILEVSGILRQWDTREVNAQILCVPCSVCR